MSLRGKRVKPAVEEPPAPPGGGSGWLERGDHPLMADLTLDTLFRIVRRFDLKTCRLVCKKWNFRTIPQMRATFRVTIHGNNFWGPHPRSIEHFVELFSSNELGIPFDSFSLGPFCTTHGDGRKFLQLCGDIAKEIDLKVDTRPIYGYTIEDVSELLRCCPDIIYLGFTSRLTSRRCSRCVKLFPDSMPTLEKITFQPGFCGFDKPPREDYASVVEELLIAAPNISEIIVRDIEERSGADNGDDASRISVVSNCIEKLGRESSIQSFHFHNARIRDIEHLRRMGEKKNGLKLKNLTFRPHLNTDEDFGSGLIQLATIFKNTLQSFNVNQIPENNLMGFPLMPNLKSLAFIFRAYQHTAPKPTNLTQKFPGLERLDVEFEFESEWADWSRFFSQFDPCPTIKSLSVRGGHMQINTFHDIQRVFPNLTKLDFLVENHSEEILRRIWSEMTELESLSISISIERKKGVSLDSLFTGIPTQALDGIRSILYKCGFDVMTVQQKKETILNLTEQHSQLPSIRNLTKLRHLDLNLDIGIEVHRRRKIYLTELTAYLALYSMNHLRHLNLKRCLFTKTCCEILTKETGLESWGFRNTEKEYENIIPPFILQGHP